MLAAHQTRYLSKMYLQKFGLTTGEWKVLPIIGYFAPMSAKEVGERTSLEPEKVTRAVDRLVARGLVTRYADANDRRRVVLSLAPKGENVFRRSEAIRGVIERKLLTALGARERAAFSRILDKLERHTLDMFSGRQTWQTIIDEKQACLAGKTRKRGGMPLAHATRGRLT